MQGSFEAHTGSRGFLHCNVRLDCSRSSVARLLIWRILRHTSLPVGFFAIGVNLENADGATVTVRLLRDRLHKKPRRIVHKRRVQDVPVKEA